MVADASTREMGQSPVVYGGYSEDAKLFARLLPVPALFVVNALLNEGLPRWEVGVLGFATYLALLAGYSLATATVAKQREEELQALRTSTSTTLPATGLGDAAFVAKSQALLQSSWRTAHPKD